MLDALTLDQLRAFISVAEQGSFSAAARKLCRVQSAISQAVKAMETTLDVQLFERSGKTPSLTPEGLALLQEAKDILNDVHSFRRKAASISNGMPAKMTLAVDQVLPNSLLIESLKAFSLSFPQVPVTLFTEGLGATEKRLRSQRAQFAIYAPITLEAEGLDLQFLANIRIVPVVSSTHEMADIEGPLSKVDIRRHLQLVLMDRAQTARGMVMSSRTWFFADQYSRLDYLLQGFGWSFAPFHFVEKYVSEGQLKVLQFDIFNGMSLSLPLYVASLQGFRLDKGSLWLIDYISQNLKKYHTTFIQPDEVEDAIIYSLEAT